MSAHLRRRAAHRDAVRRLRAERARAGRGRCGDLFLCICRFRLVRGDVREVRSGVRDLGGERRAESGVRGQPLRRGGAGHRRRPRRLHVRAEPHERDRSGAHRRRHYVRGRSGHAVLPGRRRKRRIAVERVAVLRTGRQEDGGRPAGRRFGQLGRPCDHRAQRGRRPRVLRQLHAADHVHAAGRRRLRRGGRGSHHRAIRRRRYSCLHRPARSGCRFHAHGQGAELQDAGRADRRAAVLVGRRDARHLKHGQRHDEPIGRGRRAGGGHVVARLGRRRADRRRTGSVVGRCGVRSGVEQAQRLVRPVGERVEPDQRCAVGCRERFAGC